MSTGSILKVLGKWHQQTTVGQGGFGTVTLWQHMETKELLALKKCRVNLDTKNTKRWITEIDIMKRLDHPHIVQAREVPPELQIQQGELPLLGMEFCSKGDLRKVLSRPENSCGLRQEQVLQVAKHVCSGVEYLHSKRIIHRDLKPENIVLQENEIGQIVYKLIDLGYAKDLDQGSVASTFVGTLQYLAPELFASQKYNETVDYWTLGTVLFECITGTRPFLPHMPPVKWHGTVKQKTNVEICAFENAEGGVNFAEHLLTPNHLTPMFQECFEKMLRYMLMFEPENRGGGKDDLTSRPNCFIFLDKMLQMQVINVLCMTTGTLHSYAIRETDKMLSVQKHLVKNTDIQVRDQDIVMSTGQSIDPEGLACQCTNTENQSGFLLFLFDKAQVPENVQSQSIPDQVKMIIQEPKTLLNYNLRKKAYAQSVYFCSQQAKDLSKLLEGARAAMLCLLRLNHKLTGLHTTMMDHIHKMEGKQEMFRLSLDCDIDCYAVQSPTGITSEKMFRSWKNAEREVVEDFSDLKKVYALNGQVIMTQTKIVELQRSPFARQKQDALVEVEVAAQKLYRELQLSKNTDAGMGFQDSSKMHALVLKSLDLRNKQTKELYSYLQKLISCKTEVENLIPKITSCVNEMKNLEKRMLDHQFQRQKDVWTLLKHAVSKVHNSAPSTPVPILSYSRQSSSASSGSSGAVVSPSPTAAVLLSMSSIGNKTMQDSLTLMSQSSITRTRFEDVVESIVVEQEELRKVTESDKWSFLNGINATNVEVTSDNVSSG